MKFQQLKFQKPISLQVYTGVEKIIEKLKFEKKSGIYLPGPNLM